MGQNAGERTGQRNFEPVKNPRRAERTDDEPMPPAPRHPVEPRRRVRFDAFAWHICELSLRVDGGSAKRLSGSRDKTALYLGPLPSSSQATPCALTGASRP